MNPSLIYFPQIFDKITLTAPHPPHLHLPPLQVTPTLNLDPPAIFHHVVLLHHQAAAVAGGFIDQIMRSENVFLYFLNNFVSVRVVLVLPVVAGLLKNLTSLYLSLSVCNFKPFGFILVQARVVQAALVVPGTFGY